MSSTLASLTARREALVLHAAMQRQALSLQLRPLRAPLAWVDQGITVLRVVRERPIWVFAGALLLGSLGPGRVGVWLQRALLATQVVARLRVG